MTTQPRRQPPLWMADADGVLGLLWLGNRFTGVEVAITKLVLDGGAWVAQPALAWRCDGASRDPGGNLTLRLRGGAGTGQRAGLEVADRDRWRYAPEPGTSARIGATIVTV